MEIQKTILQQYLDTIKLTSDERKNTLFVAHRGVSNLERENTCPAFVAAGQRTYFGVECDIHRTLDNVFLVMHDSNFKRVAGVEKNICDLTYAECAAIPFFGYDDKTPRIDLRAPRVEEYFDILSHYDKYAVLELKDDFTNEELDRIVEIAKSYDHLEKTVFITFLFDVAKRLRARYPEVTIQYLASNPAEGVTLEDHQDQLIDIAINYNMDLDVYYKIVTPEFIDKIHAAGHKINTWTVNTKEDAITFCGWGIDYITTNIIE